MRRIGAVALALAALVQPAWADMESAVAAYDAGDYPAAYRELYPLAVQHNAMAAYLVARMHLAGQGVPQNVQEGLKWLLVAAERDEVAAQLQLGTRYELGLGVVQNDIQAFTWYKRAADLGSPVGQLYVGTAYSSGRGVATDLVAAHVWLNLATAALPPGQIRSSAAKLRDSVTAQLTPEDLAAAHDVARTWAPRPAD
jgi:TPR repeat protein